MEKRIESTPTYDLEKGLEALQLSLRNIQSSESIEVTRKGARCAVIRRGEGTEPSFEIILSIHEHTDAGAEGLGAESKPIVVGPGSTFKICGTVISFPDLTTLEHSSESLTQKSSELRAFIPTLFLKGSAGSGEPVVGWGPSHVGEVAAVTGFGRKPNKRKQVQRVSQDGFLAEETSDRVLHLAVMDGHYTYGHIATSFLQHLLANHWRNGESSREILRDVSLKFTEMILAQGIDFFTEVSSSGSTKLAIGACVTAVDVLPNGSVIIDHLGDTRCTILRPQGKECEVLYESTDHNVEAQRLADGKTPSLDGKDSSILTRAVHPVDKFDVIDIPEQHKIISVVPGDWIVLTSDGARVVGSDVMYEAIVESARPQEVVVKMRELLEELIEMRGYSDDYVLVAVKIGEMQQAQPSQPQ